LKGIKKGFIKVGFFALGLALGLSLLAACAAPVQEVTPSTATPSSAASSPETPVPAAPTVTTPSPVETSPVAPSPAATFPMEITDNLGRVVKIKKMPQRIVSIAPSNTEILFALGLGDKVVGVDQYSDYPAEAKTKVIIGGYSTANVEKIVEQRPDLILATSIHQSNVIPVLVTMGYTVVALDPKTVDEVLDSISLVGKITGKQAEATEVVTGLSNRIKAVTDKTKTLAQTQRPRVFYVVWYDPLMSSGNGTFQADLIEKAGGTNVAQGLSGWVTISLEAVLTSNPEVMIAGDMSAGGANFNFVNTEPRLKDTSARKNSFIFTVNSDLASRPGPRLVNALEQFAKVIHPELFK